MYLANKGEI